MDKYAVIGSPIKHSLSPEIHRMFAAQTGQELEYTAIEVTIDTLFDSINRLAREGYKGLNITVPLKGIAWDMADNCNEASNRAQAVNTLKFEADGRRCGFNTDGIGFLRDLTVNHNVELQDKDILILGAGGAVRGILAPLIGTRPRSLTIANRTVEKCELLAEKFSDLAEIAACGYPALEGKQFDIIINGTAAGLHNEVPPLPDNILRTAGVSYDMMYGKEPTAFVKWGQQQNAALALDGLGMLVEQAAEAFKIWRNVSPNTAEVITALRAP